MILSDIQTQMVDLLQQDAWLAVHRVAVLAENRADFAAEVARLSQAQKISALVMTANFASKSKAGKSIVGELDVIVQIDEFPAVNREEAGYATALDAAEYIAARYNLETLPGHGPLVCKGIASPASEALSLIYTVTFSTVVTLSLILD